MQPLGKSPITAFFDVDETLITSNSATIYAAYMAKIGKISRRDILRALWFVTLHRMNRLDGESVGRRMIARGRGTPIEEVRADCENCFREELVHYLSDEGVRAVRAHQAEGHRVVLLSASTQYVCEPLSKFLEIDGAICNELLDEEGLLTGTFREPYCYGPGKRVRVEQWASEHGVDLARSYFYADSVTDLPVLEAVGHPVPVNPDRELLREARSRGWPRLRWRRLARSIPPRPLSDTERLMRQFSGRRLPEA
ncbi:MAG: HAD family hydrolase [Chrysiogenetes bacterium]|nr:HAD family hydrolase [Chrysiogenetes bacterium]